MNLRLPVPEWVPVTQWYGENMDWYPNTNGHAGIDFGTPWGTFVTATDAGVVKLAGLTTPAYWSINSGGTTIDFYTNMSLGAWTNANGKRVRCVATYEI